MYLISVALRSVTIPFFDRQRVQSVSVLKWAQTSPLLRQLVLWRLVVQPVPHAVF